VLLQLLRREAEPVVVIDLSGVSYLDMSGLATLLEALKAARRHSVTLRVLGMTGQSRMLAEIAELDTVFRGAGSEVEFPMTFLEQVGRSATGYGRTPAR
jgi:anti-anti-sigma factor